MTVTLISVTKSKFLIYKIVYKELNKVALDSSSNQDVDKKMLVIRKTQNSKVFVRSIDTKLSILFSSISVIPKNPVQLLDTQSHSPHSASNPFMLIHKRSV